MRLISVLCLLLVCFSPLASAGSVTFTDPLDAYVYTVYDSSGNFVGDYNSTDTLILDSAENYQVFVKPNTISLASNPIEASNWMMAYVPVFLSLGLVGIMILGLFVIYRKGVRL